MNTKIKRGFLAIVLFLPILFIVIILIDTVFESTNVQAYPGPPTATATPAGYPPPVTSTPTPTPGGSSPPEFQPTTHLFVPGLRKDFKMRFSISGETDINKIRQVIPAGLETEGYVWNYHHPSAIKLRMIRPCINFRNKITDPSGVQFLAGYQENQEGRFCWDSGDELDHAGTKRIVQIIDSPDCPDQGAYVDWENCLDVQIDESSHAAEEDFAEQYIDAHPDYIWLVGNEPDNTWQDALNTSFDNYHADYTTYAEFYAYMYNLVLSYIPTEHISPKLVFCQATFAGSEVPNWGLNYCENAFNELNIILEENYGYPEGFARNIIYALSTHQYLVNCHDLGEPYNQKCDGELLDEDILSVAMEKVWVPGLQEFEQWAQNVGMGDKPLWLTEFGSFSAWCFVEQSLLGPDPGVPCKATNHPDSDPDNGCMPDPYDDLEEGRDVYFGRNEREGLWGLQRAQIGYLSQNNNWRRAWWFNNRIGGYDPCAENGMGPQVPSPSGPSQPATLPDDYYLCGYSGWIWGHNGLCFNNNSILSHVGITLRDSITKCIIVGEDCTPWLEE